MPDAQTVDILGVPYTPLPPTEAIARIVELHDREEPAFVAHANVHTVNLATDDHDYREVLGGADLVLNDGKGVKLGARILGKKFPADLNGNFFTPLVLHEAAARDWSVFFYGAKPGVAERAANLLAESVPGLRVVGARDGYVPLDQMNELCAHIRATGTTLLLVGLGNPLQERWMAEYLDETDARLAIGVGAFFDFQTGEVGRAPRWMQKLGIEWVHRLFKEPSRMWRRYLVGNPRFIWNVLKQRFRKR